MFKLFAKWHHHSQRKLISTFWLVILIPFLSFRGRNRVKIELFKSQNTKGPWKLNQKTHFKVTIAKSFSAIKCHARILNFFQEKQKMAKQIFWLHVLLYNLKPWSYREGLSLDEVLNERLSKLSATSFSTSAMALFLFFDDLQSRPK